MNWRIWIRAIVFVYAVLVTPALSDRNAPGDLEKIAVVWVFVALINFGLRGRK